jgi:hypothetical protein
MRFRQVDAMGIDVAETVKDLEGRLKSLRGSL